MGACFLERFCVFKSVKVSSVAEIAVEPDVGHIASDWLAWCLDFVYSLNDTRCSTCFRTNIRNTIVSMCLLGVPNGSKQTRHHRHYLARAQRWETLHGLYDLSMFDALEHYLAVFHPRCWFSGFL